MFPSVFLSHGAPTLPLSDAPARAFLAELGADLGKPAAILVASAHWETADPTVGSAAHPQTIHDFYGFPRELYELRYQPPGAPALAEDTAALLAQAGMQPHLDPNRGLDHGAWVPLMLMYPQADIPVLQISLQSRRGPAHHWRLGQALAPLRNRNILVLGSGSLTHNLGGFRGQPEDAPALPEADAFATWCARAMGEGRVADLLAYRLKAPFAAGQHPTEEHFLPLFVALGAAGAAAKVTHLHASSMHAVLRMDAYRFDTNALQQH